MSIRRNARWEDMEKGNIDLSRLIKHFESFNRSEGKSPRTLEWYTYVMEFFRHWLEEGGWSTALKDVGEDEVREFILYLQERRVNSRLLSSHTMANRVRGLKGFFSWLGRQGYTEVDVLERLKVPKTDEKLVEILTPKEVDQLFSAINANSAFGARNSAMVALLLGTGLRLSELSGLEEEECPPRRPVHQGDGERIERADAASWRQMSQGPAPLLLSLPARAAT